MPLLLAPEQPFANVARQMNKLIEQMQKGYYNFSPGETWTPSVNLLETTKAYVVCVDVAGVDKDKIEITIEGQVLRLRGHRVVPDLSDGVEPAAIAELKDQRVRVHLMEIDHGAFSREVELPHDVQQETINARYRNGLLWIELPKKA